MDTKEVGNLGENLACEYLVGKGYKILGRNYRITLGEIDIIAKKRGFFSDKTIHFVEVKSSEGVAYHFFPEERVNYKKQNKYKRLAEVWLLQHHYRENYPCQVDILAISLIGNAHEVKYFENVVAN